MKYKRAKVCPYCGKNFNMTYDRYMRYSHKPPFQPQRTICKHCGEWFWYRNITPKFERETGIKAVLRRDEIY